MQRGMSHLGADNNGDDPMAPVGARKRPAGDAFGADAKVLDGQRSGPGVQSGLIHDPHHEVQSQPPAQQQQQQQHQQFPGVQYSRSQYTRPMPPGPVGYPPRFIPYVQHPGHRQHAVYLAQVANQPQSYGYPGGHRQSFSSNTGGPTAPAAEGDVASNIPSNAHASSNAETAPEVEVTRNVKGLRHFSRRVADKVKLKGTTTYNEVADELVEEFSAQAREAQSSQKFDHKNVRRRVYDALNVLMAMDIIEKDKKEIRWTGLPAHGTLQKQLSMLQRRNIELRAIVDAERRVVQERLKKQRLLRGLIHRNMSRDSVIGTADDSGDGSNKAGRLRLRIPLIVLRSTKDVEMRVESNIEEGIYLVSSTRPFEILQDLDILDMLMNPKTRSYVDANAQVESIPAVPSTQAMGLPGHAQSGSGMPYVIPQHHYARSQRAMPTHMFQATHPVQASPQYQHLQQFQRFHPHQYQQFDDIQNQFHGQVPNKQSRPYHPDYYRNMMTANPNNATMYPDYVPAGAVRPESSSLTLPLPSAFGYASHPASPGFLQGHADELLSFPHPLKKEGE